MFSEIFHYDISHYVFIFIVFHSQDNNSLFSIIFQLNSVNLVFFTPCLTFGHLGWGLENPTFNSYGLQSQICKLLIHNLPLWATLRTSCYKEWMTVNLYMDVVDGHLNITSMCLKRSSHCLLVTRNHCLFGS